MTLGRFNAILDAYGASPERWPATERTAALELARSSPAAARALRMALALDRRLRASTTPDIAADPANFIALHSTIVAAALPHPENWLWRWLGFELAPVQLWHSLAGLTIASLLGFAVGLGGLTPVEKDRDLDDVAIVSSLDLPVSRQ